MFLIKFLFKTAIYLLLTAVLLIVCLGGLAVWLAPHYAPSIVTNYVESETGFGMSIKKLGLSALGGSAFVKGVYLENPSEYQDKHFVHLRELSGKLQLGSLLGDKIVVDEALMDLASVTVVKNSENQLNVNEFKKGFEDDSNTASVESDQSSSEPTDSPVVKKDREYLIKRLTVRLGSFSIVGIPDNTSAKQDYSINYEHVFTDVTDIQSVADQMEQELQKYGIQILLNGLLGKLNPQDVVKNLVNGNLDKLIHDSKRLSYEHAAKADNIVEQPYVNPNARVFGALFEVQGNAASQSQFFVTDSTEHFLTGSVYFYTKPNYDSILPAADYLQKDIKRIMETVIWK